MPAENGSTSTDRSTNTNEHGSKQPASLPVLSQGLPGSFPGLAAQRHIEPRIERMEAEMEAARKAGVWGLLRLRYEAWLEQKMQGPAIQKMQARQAVLEEQRKTAEAEIRLKATVSSGEVRPTFSDAQILDTGTFLLWYSQSSLHLFTRRHRLAAPYPAARVPPSVPHWFSPTPGLTRTPPAP